MLFPHLLLFPYQPAYDSASSASKLYKTQGKLPQRDTPLLFPLASSSSSSTSSSLFPPLSLRVTNQSVYLSTGCTSWECSLKQIQCPPLAYSHLSYSVREKLLNVSISSPCGKKREHSLFTKGHRWSSGLLSNLSFFIITPFFQKIDLYKDFHTAI